jgi:CRISPR/Cas system-associated exonuclease Cas4 (RecB family)
VGKVLTSKQLIEINKLLEITTEKACIDIEIQNQIEDGKNLLLVNIAKQFVKNFLRAEYQYVLANESNNRLLTILSLENELTGNIQVQHQTKAIDIKLNGFADRIDRVGDTIRIIDYKTGTVSERKLAVAEVSEIFGNDEYDKALQLMHYAYLFQQKYSDNKHIQSGIISFRNFKNGMLNLKLNGNEIIALENYQSYEHNLQQMIAEMLSIERTINQTANLDSCNLCGFAALCKRN